MLDLFRFKNRSSQNEKESTEIKVELSYLDLEKGMDSIREQAKEKYGWQSPYEYYYGTQKKTVKDLGRDCNTILSLEEIEKYKKATEDSKSEAADKDNVPNYFWVNSLSNWCYFKISSYTPTFSHTYQTLPGWARVCVAWLTCGLTEAIEHISREGWGSWWKIPVDMVSAFLIPAMALPMAIAYVVGAGSLVSNYGEVSLPFLLYNIITGASQSREADLNAESMIEMCTSDPAEIMMPRAGISLYMWNGYTRSWTPVKHLVETYDRYCKRLSEGYYIAYLDKQFLEGYRRKSDRPNVNGLDYLGNYFLTYPLTEEHQAQWRAACEEWKARDWADKRQALNKLLAIFESPEEIENQTYYLRQMARELIIETFMFDPWAFDFLTQRSPINKKQTLGVDNHDSHHWGEWHYMENWGMYIPLSRDSAKIKSYADQSFQLINRPYSYVAHDYRDHNCWIHRNLGHPCFFRGNDDQLWMAYWMRWSTGNLNEHKNKHLLSEDTTMDGAYDISTDDIQNWDEIIETMFEKHDDYGFDEWMVNGDYGCAYKKFTIDEESPTAISSVEESTLNPEKIPPVNSIDRSDGARLKFTLSTGTVIGRDDQNGLLDTAKRWK